MYCYKCGGKNADNADKCAHCGTIMQQAPAGKKSKTALIVLVVVAIALVLFAVIGIIAAIAIPSLVSHQAKARDAMARAEVKNACTAAAAFFMEHPDKTITVDDLKEQGIARNPEVELDVENGTMADLTIRARHIKGHKTYVADRNCTIREVHP
jgi:competence protein ComGC